MIAATTSHAKSAAREQQRRAMALRHSTLRSDSLRDREERRAAARHPAEALVATVPSLEEERRLASPFGGGAEGAFLATGADFILGTLPEEVLASLSRPSRGLPPAPGQRQQICYVCRKSCLQVHHHFLRMCPPCGDLNMVKRFQGHDLTGRVALVTGARVKIGFAVGLKLLRCGATLIATSRFPHDCARRYAQQADSAAWLDRLFVYGVDLRDMNGAVRLCAHIAARWSHLDLLVNNAAQTVRRPPVFYRHLLPGEEAPLPAALADRVQADPHAAAGGTGALEAPLKRHLVCGSSGSSGGAIAVSVPMVETPKRTHMATSAALSQTALVPCDECDDPKIFPPGLLDANGQQVDLRRETSWTQRLATVDLMEVLEVFVVNAIGPIILNQRLLPLLERAASRSGAAHIVNVSAMEGKFARPKSTRHPHTNMAKAALNMMTRTAAADYAASGVYMNSVDTGWVTQEKPPTRGVEALSREECIALPINEVDAMARVLDPFFVGLKTGRHAFGKFFKDFAETEW